MAPKDVLLSSDWHFNLILPYTGSQMMILQIDIFRLITFRSVFSTNLHVSSFLLATTGSIDILASTG